MNIKVYKDEVKKLLEEVDVKINGSRPWDIQIINEAVYRRVFQNGTLGFGEAYMDGQWECQAIDQLIEKLVRVNLDAKVNKNIKFFTALVLSKIINYGRKEKSEEVAHQHYNLETDLFSLMLDSRMVYTCGYWKNAKNLDEAQEDKLDLVCQKLGFKKGMSVLDIGGGYGSLAKFAAEKYGTRVVNVTNSREHFELANKLCQGLTVENRLMDYREIKGQFDRVVSLGMFEHVGYKNYRTYMEVVSRSLKEDGMFLLHTIGGNETNTQGEPWIQKYIFPNSMPPSAKQITYAIEGLFVMEDWHNFGADYDKTLVAWCNNFERSWPKLKRKYGEKFYRMWKYYLLACAGMFRARQLQLWQIVLSKHGVVGGYQSIR